MVSITRVLLLAAVAVAAVSARKSGPVRFAWMPMTTHVEGACGRRADGMTPPLHHLKCTTGTPPPTPPIPTPHTPAGLNRTVSGMVPIEPLSGKVRAAA